MFNQLIYIMSSALSPSWPNILKMNNCAQLVYESYNHRIGGRWRTIHNFMIRIKGNSEKVSKTARRIALHLFERGGGAYLAVVKNVTRTNFHLLHKEGQYSQTADETVTIVQEKVPISIFSQISISPSWAYWGGGGLIEGLFKYMFITKSKLE